MSLLFLGSNISSAIWRSIFFYLFLKKDLDSYSLSHAEIQSSSAAETNDGRWGAYRGRGVHAPKTGLCSLGAILGRLKGAYFRYLAIFQHMIGKWWKCWRFILNNSHYILPFMESPNGFCDIFPVPSEFSQVFTEVKEAQKFLLCMELMIRRAQEDRTSMAWHGAEAGHFWWKILDFFKMESGK